MGYNITNIQINQPTCYCGHGIIVCIQVSMDVSCLTTLLTDMVFMSKKLFEPKKHIKNLISKEYYRNLVLLRNEIEKGCNTYFRKLGAPKVDLYLISNSVSSPVALGSDSKPIAFDLDGKDYFLTDSSQFGMEPLLFNSFDIVYCYLPSFRGEDPDSRHLNQFYHCETELIGGYIKAMDIAENLVKNLTKDVLKGLKRRKFSFKDRPSLKKLELIVKSKFPRITLEEAVKLLESKGYKNLVKYEKFGRVLTGKAENMITKLVSNNKLPVWIVNYDRDTVAFYQKSGSNDDSKVLNADLVAPRLVEDGFGGEILGLGQRQNKAGDIIESMKRQNIKNDGQYDWYIQLRKNPKYQTTSGFGMGIERYISWILGLNSLVDACIYPVLKNSKTSY
jgi:asparaginyl-tRNA synthetase